MATSQNQEITLTWNASQVPSHLCAYLRTGIGVIDMKTQSSVTLPTGTHSLIITVSRQCTIVVSLKAGWNMISVPVIPANNSVGAVFPNVAAVYTWDTGSKSYTVPTIVTPNTGYWVAVAADKTIPVSGIPVSTWTKSIKAGWNMVGSVINSADFTAPNDNPDASVQGFAYWWNPTTKAYDYKTTIEPGKGYWVASVKDCQLILP